MLYLVEENDGIMRSHGRLMNAKLPYKTKVPIVLSRKHKLANLLVIDSHTKVLHNGVRQTLTELRSSYWIPKVKSFVKKILYHCTVCRRFNSRSYDYPKSPNLPSIRLRDDVAFSGTGVDYLGPIYCKNVYSDDLDDENESHKSYVSLYTCASTRGVVLDLVHDGQAKTFINSCIRFISRRGCLQEILSDNGSAFMADETQTRNRSTATYKP